jgi:hypothetical protein
MVKSHRIVADVVQTIVAAAVLETIRRCLCNKSKRHTNVPCCRERNAERLAWNDRLHTSFYNRPSFAATRSY